MADLLNQENSITVDPDATLTRARANKNYAAMLNVSADVPGLGLDDTNPVASLAVRTGSTNQDRVLGEFTTRHSDSTATVYNKGRVELRCTAAVGPADRGKGVLASNTAGVVAIGDFGTGVGRIMGGGTRKFPEGTDGADVDVNIAVVLLP